MAGLFRLQAKQLMVLNQSAGGLHTYQDPLMLDGGGWFVCPHAICLK
jgi:hypothetical protein